MRKKTNKKKIEYTGGCHGLPKKFFILIIILSLFSISVYALPVIDNVNTASWASTGSGTWKIGWKFVTNYQTYLKNVTKYDGSNATDAVLLNSLGNTILANASFIGNTATFSNYNLSAGTTYIITSWSNGLSHKTYGTGSGGYPQAKTAFNITGGWVDGADPGQYEIIQVVTDTDYPQPIPPSKPNITNPLPNETTTQGFFINITWTNSTFYNAQLSYYNITLLNNDTSINSSINENVSNLFYYWNTSLNSIRQGYYKLRVAVYDNNSKSNFTISEQPFYYYPYNITMISPTPDNNSNIYYGSSFIVNLSLSYNSRDCKVYNTTSETPYSTLGNNNNYVATISGFGIGTLILYAKCENPDFLTYTYSLNRTFFIVPFYSNKSDLIYPPDQYNLTISQSGIELNFSWTNASNATLFNLNITNFVSVNNIFNTSELNYSILLTKALYPKGSYNFSVISYYQFPYGNYSSQRILNICSNNWANITSACSGGLSLLTYIDTNNCPIKYDLPSDNGTYLNCTMPPSTIEYGVITQTIFKNIQYGIFFIAILLIILIYLINKKNI